MISLSVEDDAPPLVRAIANELGARLGDPGFVDATRALEGVVCLRDAGTPQTATLRLTGDEIALSHREPESADVAATASMEGAGDDVEIEGASAHPELAEWTHALLAWRVVAWADAAERFWSALAEMPGAPAALLVIDSGSGEERRFGAPNGPAFELHGDPDALAAVLTGRVPLIDAAFAGEVLVRGSFSECSVFTGAGFEIRYGPRVGYA